MRIRERSRRGVATALVLVLPLFLISFAAKCGGGKNASSANNVNGAASADSVYTVKVDNELRTKVRQNLTERSANSNTGLSALDIEVNVSKGKVTLSGPVKSQATRDEAKRIAEETEVSAEGRKLRPAGVDVSGLTVTPPSPAASPTP